MFSTASEASLESVPWIRSHTFLVQLDSLNPGSEEFEDDSDESEMTRIPNSLLS